jgi:predicted flap endonuclease-1-like 5' DNA nuclease
MALDVKRNIGKLDKNVRFAIGGFLVLIGLAWGSFLVVLLGVVLVATAWFGWCPPYDLMGINTTQLKSTDLIDPEALSKRALSPESWCGFLNSSNLGDNDRYWRYGLGGFALLIGYAFSSSLWFLIGFILFATAISTRCPLYHILGYSSQKKNDKGEKSAAEISAEVFEISATEKIGVAAPIEAKEADVSIAKPLQKAKKKPVAKKVAEKPRKAQAKPKAAAKKATKPKPKEAAAKAAPKTKKKVVKAKGLTVIEGIGPKISEILQKNGLTDFSLLANSDSAKIKEMLLAEGSRYAMHDPESWPEQAAMARDEKWDELKKWQDEHKGGRKK